MHHVSAQFMEFFVVVLLMIAGAVTLYTRVIKPRFESDGRDSHPSHPHPAEASGRGTASDHPEAH